jgi:hypothetical protein
MEGSGMKKFSEWRRDHGRPDYPRSGEVIEVWFRQLSDDFIAWADDQAAEPRAKRIADTAPRDGTVFCGKDHAGNTSHCRWNGSQFVTASGMFQSGLGGEAPFALIEWWPIPGSEGGRFA